MCVNVYILVYYNQDLNRTQIQKASARRSKELLQYGLCFLIQVSS
jgi:hypothetical protein